MKAKALLPLLAKYIKDCQQGKITKSNGKKLAYGSIHQYAVLFKHLENFENFQAKAIEIFSAARLTQRQVDVQKNYWRRFYRDFCNYLYKQGDCYDNYVGSLIKRLRCFMHHLQQEENIVCSPYLQYFYVRKEEIAIITISPERFNFLIHDKGFRNNLPDHLQKVVDIMVFGLTVGLRFSDLISTTRKQLSHFQQSTYLISKSQKTSTQTMVKLPDYLLSYISSLPRNQSLLLPQLSKNQFNAGMKKIGEIAGWTETLPKYRERQGKALEIFRCVQEKSSYRFCDHMSSHMLRRSAITNMLLLGMNEMMVRKISGHAPGSKEFYRYVDLAQNYLDTETDLFHEKLKNLGKAE